MNELKAIRQDEFDPTKPGIYVLVLQGKNFADMAQNFAAAMHSPKFQGLKLLHVVHGQEMRMNPLHPGQVDVTFSIMAIVERIAES